MSSTTWRFRTSTLALIGACLLAMAGGASAWGADARLVVNTPHDVVPDPGEPLLGSWVEGAGGPNPELHPAVASCLGNDATDSSTSFRKTLADAEDAVNKFLADDPSSNPSNPGNPLPADAKVARPCSLRMALHAANVLRNSTATGGDGGVLITFRLPTSERRISVAGVTSLDEEVAPLPPLVDPVGTAAQTVANRTIKIDGCAIISPGSATPCVELKLPGALEDVNDLPSASSTVPELSPGVVVAGPRVTIKNIAFLGGSPAIATVPGVGARSDGAPAAGETGNSLTVTNSYFGVGLDGDVEAEDRPGVAIQLSGNNATIGGTERERNVFGSGDVGVLIAGGNGNRVQGNWFGVDGTGAKLPDPALETGVRLTGARNEPDALDDLVLSTIREVQKVDNPVPDGTVPLFRGSTPLGADNTIGGKLSSNAAGSTGSCDGVCNLFAASEAMAIDVGNEALRASSGDVAGGDLPAVSDTRIQGNWFGVDAQGARGGTVDAPSIVVRNRSADTMIGGSDERSEGNRVANSGGPGVSVADDAGENTVVERNFGFPNAGMLIDLGGDGTGEEGVGNAPDGPGGGVQSPEIAEANPEAVRGRATPGASIHLYVVPGQTGGEHRSRRGHVESFLGRATTRPDGTWALNSPAVAVGQKVTATANAGAGTSELATNRVVTDPPARQEQQIPPPPAPPEPPLPPPPPPPDREAPEVVSVLGKPVPSRASTRVATPMPSAIAGRAQDPSGIRRVDVALSLPVRARRARSRPRRQTCSFVDFRRARFVRRDCARPLFARARGTGAWRLPLSRKTRKLLRRGRTYTLHIRTVDRVGNAATKTVLIRFR